MSRVTRRTQASKRGKFIPTRHSMRPIGGSVEEIFAAHNRAVLAARNSVTD